MIRWCSHCQKFLGEKPPLDDYTITHSICSDCAGKMLNDHEISAETRAIAQFYKEILNSGKHGDLLSVSEVLTRGRELHLRPHDLLMGILQPALYEIGKAWECGEIIVEAERKFSSLVQDITSFVVSQDESNEHLRNSKSPDVLLLQAEGNKHSMGILVMEAFLVLHGISSRTIFPDLPSHEAVKLAAELKPRIIGISLAMPGQESTLRIFNDWLATQAPAERPACLVGGRWARLHAEEKFGLITIARGPEAIFEFLRPAAKS